MTAKQQDTFKKILEDRRAELCRDIEAQRERLNVDPLGDSMDQVRVVAERDLALWKIDNSSAILRLIERSLRNIREETYGICAHCEEDIPVKRLQAVPWSPYCVTCQHRAEGEDAAPHGGRTAFAIAS